MKLRYSYSEYVEAKPFRYCNLLFESVEVRQMSFRFSTIIFLVFFSISPAGAGHLAGHTPGLGDFGEGDGYYPDMLDPDIGIERSNPKGLLNSTTNRVVNKVLRTSQNCQALDLIYRFDCFRQHYKMLASRLEDNPSYAIPLQVFRDIEKTLEIIVAENADPAAKPLRNRGRTYRAITQASTAKATATFNQALSDASTMLLRSSSDNAGHFSRIAAALDSNKILLRSALLQLFRAYGKANNSAYIQGPWKVI